MYSGKRQNSHRAELDARARAMIKEIGIAIREPPENSQTTGSVSRSLAFKHTTNPDYKSKLSKHRDIRGSGKYRHPQGVVVATFYFKKSNGKYHKCGHEELPATTDLPSVNFAAGDTKFQLHPSDGSVYFVTGSANAWFTHEVTCKCSKSGDWLRVSVPTFVFW